ncbi:MAG: acyl-CoA/acyl-ACP dehydrogenase [Dehalococcoidia bacterium]|nr:acyl-CoA/acyl-ACP dehydrogenase [Dehalococcoidia bacterium]MDD5493635.1 acyl-CoA/acyl-ACP dehydrogenase [Dehalococcoidia bacterium]
MDLRFTEQQEILKKSARDFLTKECPKAKVRELEHDAKGYDPDLWQKMADLGWLGFNIPEEYEGMGYSFEDLTVHMEEVGRNILPGPYMSTVVNTFAIVAAGADELKKDLLPKISYGKCILTLAWLEENGQFDASGITLKAAQKGSDFVLNGTKVFVDGAHIADNMIVVARTKESAKAEDGVTLFVVDAKAAGIKSTVIPTIAHDHLCEVVFKDVAVPAKNVLGKVDKGWEILQMIIRKGSILKSAESLGGLQSVVEMTVAYSKERVQYDRPIGAFQALQHKMSDMWIAMGTSKYLLYEAAWMESNGIPNAKEASMAKAYINEAYKLVGALGVKLHGGIGTSYDHDVPLFFRRAKAADTVYGSTDYHRELVAQFIGLK